VKTDAIDLEAIADLVLAGGGNPVNAQDEVLSGLAAWAAHRSLIGGDSTTNALGSRHSPRSSTQGHSR
jgi:hypothetical protein